MDALNGSAVTLASATAGDIMTTPVITVEPHTTARQAAQILTRHRISAAPVVGTDKALLGMVSEYDLLSKAGETVRDVMTAAVVSVSIACPVDALRHLLIDRRIRRVPVMAEGYLVGIVSLHDVLGMLATEWVCLVCGEPVRGEHAPRRGPRCQAPGEKFELQEQPPGA